MMSAARYFIPVCLYPHTTYRTTLGVAALFEKYQLCSHDYFIVVADRLLVLDRLVTGRYWTMSSATTKARQEAKQIISLIKRMSCKADAQTRGQVVYWDEITDTAQFMEFAHHLQDAVLADPLLASAIDEFVDGRVKRFGSGRAPDQERYYEREYLLSEMCMSVYCTEVLNFWIEVWERPLEADVPDPLKLLYAARPGLVGRLTGRPAARVLNFLYPDAHSKEWTPQNRAGQWRDTGAIEREGFPRTAPAE